MNSIFKRRSVRNYTGESISDEQLQKILHAAMAAPSARNQQPWEFIVVKNKDAFKKIMEVHPYSMMLKEAAAAIIVCGNEQKNYDGQPYWHVDCAASIQNILLESTELELGAVWLGVYPREDRMKEIADLFELPSHIKPHAIVSIGVPKDTPQPADRYDSTKVHYEKW
jgi:nitroreductase